MQHGKQSILPKLWIPSSTPDTDAHPPRSCIHSPAAPAKTSLPLASSVRSSSSAPPTLRRQPTPGIPSAPTLPSTNFAIIRHILIDIPPEPLIHFADEKITGKPPASPRISVRSRPETAFCTRPASRLQLGSSLRRFPQAHPFTSMESLTLPAPSQTPDADSITCTKSGKTPTVTYQRAGITSIKLTHRGRSTLVGLGIGAETAGAIVGFAAGTDSKGGLCSAPTSSADP